jgi:hypothetical protein
MMDNQHLREGMCTQDCTWMLIGHHPKPADDGDTSTFATPGVIFGRIPLVHTASGAPGLIITLSSLRRVYLFRSDSKVGART